MHHTRIGGGSALHRGLALRSLLCRILGTQHSHSLLAVCFVLSAYKTQAWCSLPDSNARHISSQSGLCDVPLKAFASAQIHAGTHRANPI